MAVFKQLAKSIFFSAVLISPVWAQPLAGTIAAVSGAAQLVRKTSAGEQQLPLHAGDPVFEGDTVVTKSLATAKLLMADNSVLDLGPETSFQVTQFTGNSSENRNAVFNVLYGRLRALVTKSVSGQGHMEVRTKDSVMGVRGTEFILNASTAGKAGSGTQTQLTVVSGAMSLNLAKGSSSPVLLSSGMQSSVRAGANAPTAPATLSQGQLTSMTNQSRVKDNTFDKAVTVDSSSSQNDRAASPASARSLATVQVATLAAHASEIADAKTTMNGIGAFDLLSTLNTVPATILPPPTTRTVSIKLSH